MKLAVDAGHGFVKAVTSDGRREHFPALIAPVPVEHDLGGFGHDGTVRAAIREGLIGEERVYLIGAAAARHAAPAWARDKAADKTTQVLVQVAAAMLLSPDGEPAELAVGLPLAWFGQKESLRGALSRKVSRVQFRGGEHEGKLVAVSFERVRVFPQGVGAAAHCFVGRDWEPGGYLVVDVGYRTVDYLVVDIRPGGALAADPELAGTVEDAGIHEVDLGVEKLVQRDHAVQLDAAELLQGQVYVNGNAVNLQSYREPLLRQLADTVASHVLSKLRGRASKLRGVVLVGGGGVELSAWFGLEGLPVRVAPDAQFANALGYLKLME